MWFHKALFLGGSTGQLMVRLPTGGRARCERVPLPPLEVNAHDNEYSMRSTAIELIRAIEAASPVRVVVAIDRKRHEYVPDSI